MLFISACFICLIVVYSVTTLTNETNRKLSEAQNLDTVSRNNLAAALEDQRNMAMYADEYGQLIQRKIVGEDQRLDWMEGMEKLHRQNLVTDFRYNIAPQRIYTPQPPIDSGNFNVQYSEMTLQLDLLHEKQLVDFFIALHNQINGHYLLEKCAMHRAGDGNPPSATSTNLKAECSGGWVTLKNRNIKP